MMAGIYRRKRPWDEHPQSWMFFDRMEHYCKLKTIHVDGAIFIAAGLIPEKLDIFGIPWFDGIFISNAKNYEDGDDRDALWQWTEDCKQRWLSNQENTEIVNLRGFIDWVTQEYEEPHWMPSLRETGLWAAWTDRLVTQEKPEDRRRIAHMLLEKHRGNKAAVGREMGISRTRVNQLLAPLNEPARKSKKTPTPSSSDPFGIASKSLNKKGK